MNDPDYDETSILTVEEAAAFIKAAPSTVRGFCRLTKDQPDYLPNFKLGTHFRIPYHGLLAWVSKRSGVTMPSAPAKRRRIIPAERKKTRRLHRLR